MFRSFQHQFPALDGGIVQPFSTFLTLKISIQFVFLPMKPTKIRANIRCILVYPLPVLPDHENLRVPPPMLPRRLK